MANADAAKKEEREGQVSLLREREEWDGVREREEWDGVREREKSGRVCVCV